MEKNVGNVDKVIRLILGVIFIIIGVKLGGAFMWFFIILAALLFITSITGYCGIYSLLKINTAKCCNTYDPLANEVPQNVPVQNNMASENPQPEQTQQIPAQETKVVEAEVKLEPAPVAEPKPTAQEAEATLEGVVPSVPKKKAVKRKPAKKSAKKKEAPAKKKAPKKKRK